jgi:hypothetical protein
MWCYSNAKAIAAPPTTHSAPLVIKACAAPAVLELEAAVAIAVLPVPLIVVLGDELAEVTLPPVVPAPAVVSEPVALGLPLGLVAESVVELNVLTDPAFPGAIETPLASVTGWYENSVPV